MQLRIDFGQHAIADRVQLTDDLELGTWVAVASRARCGLKIFNIKVAVVKLLIYMYNVFIYSHIGLLENVPLDWVSYR